MSLNIILYGYYFDLTSITSGRWSPSNVVYSTFHGRGNISNHFCWDYAIISCLLTCGLRCITDMEVYLRASLNENRRIVNPLIEHQ